MEVKESYEKRLSLAIKAVHENILTAYKASKLYEIHRGTLSNHLNNKSVSTVRGRPPRFSKEQEDSLCELITTLASWCFPLNIQETISHAREFANKLVILESKSSNRLWCPGYDWLLK